eukprot:COSAG02_NODE_6533_length_3513_cov_3.082601_5_plen_73_part_00
MILWSKLCMKTRGHSSRTDGSRCPIPGTAHGRTHARMAAHARSRLWRCSFYGCAQWLCGTVVIRARLVAQPL